LNLKSEDKRIIFLGRVEDEDLGYLYSRSLGLFFASRYEGFGLPILEAMKLNTPVITSSVSSMPEVGGDAALIVDPDSLEGMAKSLEELAFNEDVRKDLIQKSQIQVNKFSWKKCASEMNQIYLSV
jgi:glycosyltransferase involved in cell wall biosynthesis